MGGGRVWVPLASRTPVRFTRGHTHPSSGLRLSSFRPCVRSRVLTNTKKKTLILKGQKRMNTYIYTYIRVYD